ncbi:plastocyanin/azurin family copper-binding protein [Halobacillus yeomjeoni]|uniref:Blue (type 1) copper domain-containing protein n=1 Tax=Halobacillus yeomjeoni TaxID=311194 RepID=A0A931HT04_9BACI|nr:plastocyanin/azurin family copper-binding protein [Halobacillus yeomjeoni]MBH0229175.1 hypothetical protein [Halobacillus yeomjeoni]
MNYNRLLIIVIGIISLFALVGCSSSEQVSEKDTEEQVANETTENESSSENETDEGDSEDKSQNSSKESDKEKHMYDENNNVIEVSAYEMGFDPSEITLKKGVEYELVLINDGDMFHDLTTTELKAEITFKGEMPDHPESMSMLDELFGVTKVHAAGDHDGHHKNSFHMNAKSGQTVKLKFIPSEVGEYEFVCTVPGHEEAGMTGTFTVVE